MFMLPTKPVWGFLVGLGSVGPAAALLVLTSDAAARRLAWMIALAAVVVGAGSASFLALQKSSAGIREAARLGAWAWMAVTLTVSLLVFWFNPFVILSFPITVLFGAVMGAAVGGLLRWTGIRVAPARRKERT